MPSTFDFSVALVALKQGTPMRRQSWPKDHYVKIENDGIYGYSPELPDGQFQDQADAKHLLADDWEEYIK